MDPTGKMPSEQILSALWGVLPPNVRNAYASGPEGLARLWGELSPGAGVRDAVNESGRLTDAVRQGSWWDAGGAGAGMVTGLLGAMPVVGAAGKGARSVAQEFKTWFGKSHVVDDANRPLIVYRGEHGIPERASARTDPSVPTTGSPSLEEIGYGGFHSKTPESLSFGDRDTANHYAMEPNAPDEVGAWKEGRVRSAEAPRVTPVHLKIENPIIHDMQDPFMELSDVRRKLGRAEAERVARQHAEYIHNTSNWDEKFAGKYADVEDLLTRNPRALDRLYVDAFPVLDDPLFVQAAKAKGYDGAIYGGAGHNALKPEYRIFHPDQARPAIGTRIKSGLLKGDEEW